MERELPTGVYSRGRRYIAAVRHRNKRYYLGCFGTVEQAEAKVQAFRAEHPKEQSGPWQPGDGL